MPGVKTYVVPKSVTEDSKGSASAHSDMALDRMSFLSFDAGTAAESVDLSPASYAEPSKKSQDKVLVNPSQRLGHLEWSEDP